MDTKTNSIGFRPNGFYIPRYRNFFGDKRGYIRGFGYQGGASRQGWNHQIAELTLGADYKDAISEPGHWKMGMGGFGETLPNHDNKVTLDKTRKENGGSIFAIDCQLRDNELTCVRTCRQMQKKCWRPPV